MKVSVKTKIGDVEYMFQVEENDEMETLHKAAVLGNPPLRCNECAGDTSFYLDSNKDKEANIYVNVVCACGAKAKLGRYKAGGYFWHKFEVYEGKNGKDKTPSAQAVSDKITGENEPPPIEDDLPF